MMLVPNPGDGRNLWLVDGNHTPLDALTWMDQFERRTVKVFSVEDMVKACTRNAISNSSSIDFLAIFGHGTGGYQSVGAAREYESTGDKSLRWKSVSRPGESELVGQAEKKIRALNGVLAAEATILLGGCNVGESAYGDGLLTTVSKILDGRRIQAFENAVYWWTSFMIGPLKEAKGSKVKSSFSVYRLGSQINPF